MAPIKDIKKITQQKKGGTDGTNIKDIKKITKTNVREAVKNVLADFFR